LKNALLLQWITVLRKIKRTEKSSITPAIKYLNIVIPAKAGIQEGTGCRIKSGMTELDYLIARLISQNTYEKTD